MLPRFFLTLLCAAATSTLASGETRAWKSADGARSVQGEFVKRTSSTVTLRTKDQPELIIELSKLHPDELAWLERNHPLSGPAPDPSAVFDTLTFNDTRDTTLAKLKASKLVEMTTSETFIGRSGLNGIFRTRQKIGELDAMLYFDWADSGKLREVTLQTDTLPVEDYKAKLEPSWEEFIELLTMLYGTPEQKGPMPHPQSIESDTFLPTHLWRLDGGGSALLGTARDGQRYQLVVRFTQKNVQRVLLP